MYCVVKYHKVAQLIHLETFVASIIDATPGPDTGTELTQMMAQLLLVECDAVVASMLAPASFSQLGLRAGISACISTIDFFTGESCTGKFSSSSYTNLFI